MQELKINAVEMVRGIREAHYEKIKDLSTKDKIEFFREKARALHAELGLPEELPSGSKGFVFRDSDPLNAENLPYLLREVGLGCDQREIAGLLKLLFSRGVATIHKLRSVATPRRVEMVRDIYLQESGRQPINFEYVANFANLGEVEDEAEMIERIRAHRKESVVR